MLLLLLFLWHSMANVVTVSEKSGGGWQLLFNGAPYYVKCVE